MFFKPGDPPSPPYKRATVYTHLSLDLFHTAFSPPNPQLWGNRSFSRPRIAGEPEFQSPPELGDLGGKKVSDANQRTCVYTVT